MHEYVPYVLYIHYICNFSAVKGIDVLKMESGLIGCFSDMYYQSGSILAWQYLTIHEIALWTKCIFLGGKLWGKDRLSYLIKPVRTFFSGL